MNSRQMRLLCICSATLLVVRSGTVSDKSIQGIGRYSGEAFLGVPHGEGTLTLDDGTVYVGECVEGYANGAGKVTWPDGSAYQGLFVSGWPAWQGTIYRVDGTAIRVYVPTDSDSSYGGGTGLSAEDKAYIDATIEANRPTISW